jgi:2,3-bisphosphoglycerate-dependent phosphoglycerate mutase
MQIYFIRHGQSCNNRLWTENGSERGRSEDPLLTDLGMKQAQKVAAFLAGEHPEAPIYLPRDMQNARGFGITHIYSSLMWRALTTASYSAERLDLPIFGLEGIHEGGGIYLENEQTGELAGQPGKTPQELQAGFPRLQFTAEVNSAGWWSRPFEPAENRIPRARGVIEWLVEHHNGSDARIAIFSHGAFFNYFFNALIGLTHRPPFWMEMNNCGMTRFDINPDGTANLIYHNRVDYLPSDWIS